VVQDDPQEWPAFLDMRGEVAHEKDSSAPSQFDQV
jgi:hypothetical protein